MRSVCWDILHNRKHHKEELPNGNLLTLYYQIFSWTTSRAFADNHLEDVAKLIISVYDNIETILEQEKMLESYRLNDNEIMTHYCFVPKIPN